MPLRFLLDTSIVSFHIRKSSRQLQRRLHAVPASAIGISVITEMELRFGLMKNPGLHVAPLVEAFLMGINTLILDSSVAKEYGKIRAELEKKGSPIGPMDLIIAAHALALGVMLITNNVREFRRVSQLRCEDWSI